jgi:molecular chaperone Hsp33
VPEPAAGAEGELRRFIFEHHPVRGFWIRLDQAWRELRSFQHYPPAVEALLGEAVGAALLLAATLKFQGTLTLQLAGDGRVKLLVAQCTHDFNVRAVARTDEGMDEGSVEGVDAPLTFKQLVGSGRLTVTIESEERSARYQGIVSLEGNSLAQCLENYFATSEQLPTRLVLLADSACVSGLLIQKMPAASSQGEAQAAVSQRVWEEAQVQLQSLEPSLLRAGTARQLLQRICGDEDSRLFPPLPVGFNCRCSSARVANVLRALGSQEIHEILAEQGTVTVTCEFCGRPYRYDAIDVERLFAVGASPETPQSLN